MVLVAETDKELQQTLEIWYQKELRQIYIYRNKYWKNNMIIPTKYWCMSHAITRYLGTGKIDREIIEKIGKPRDCTVP